MDIRLQRAYRRGRAARAGDSVDAARASWRSTDLAPRRGRSTRRGKNRRRVVANGRTMTCRA
jgi:hypothetical protein